MDVSIIEKVVERLKELPQELQWRVLEFTRTLTMPTLPGVAGANYLQFAGTIPMDDISAMKLAIEQGCEQVDANEW